MTAEVGEWELNTLMKTSTCVSSFTEQPATSEPGTSLLLRRERRTPRKFPKGKPFGRLDLGEILFPLRLETASS